MKSCKSTARTNNAMIGAASATLVLLAQACSSGSSGGTSPENDSGYPFTRSLADRGIALCGSILRVMTRIRCPLA